MNHVDFHSHTKFTDGRNTVEQNVRVAQAGGLDAVAITDHFFSADDATWIDDYVAEIERMRGVSGMTILAGVEATVLDAQGTISIDNASAAKLDIVLCDVGGYSEGLSKNVTATREAFPGVIVDCLKNVCADERVNVLAHPLNFGKWEIPLTIRDFTDAQLADLGATCAATGTAFEVMNQMCFWFPGVSVPQLTDDYVRLVRILAGEGARFSIGSDAHSAGAVGNVAWSRKVLALAGVDEKQIVRAEDYR